MLMPGRKYYSASANYRYGFNGKENDNEVKGEGNRNQQDYGMRIYDLRYERSEAAPSIDAAKKIADALEVSLDNLVGEGILKSFGKKTLQRFKDLEHLEEDKKKTLFDLFDTYIRDAKGRKAFAH